MEMISAILAIASPIFVAELTDKDALLIVALATRIKPWVVFASGLTAFTITTAIIVTIGHLLVVIVPVYWIKVVGGVIMISYGIWGFLIGKKEDAELDVKENKLLTRFSKTTIWSVFLSVVPMLVVLDLAGDATEVLTVVFVAHFQNVFLVFFAALSALVAATAVETVVGRRLGELLSLKRIRLLSNLVFLVVGVTIIATTTL
jgi:putative Ca2+/H+ antiporter (TMEM165/GDT1 family)